MGPEVLLSHRWSSQEVGPCPRPEAAPASRLCSPSGVRKAFTSRPLQIHGVSFSNLVFCYCFHFCKFRPEPQREDPGPVPPAVTAACRRIRDTASHTRNVPRSSSLTTCQQGGRGG